MAKFMVRRGSFQGVVWLSYGTAWLSTGGWRDSVEGFGIAQMRVRRGSGDRVQRGSVSVWRDPVQGAAWLISGCGVAQLGCSVDHHRVQRGSVQVRRGSVEGCDMAQLRMQRGSVRAQPGSVRVRHGSAGCCVA